MSTRKGTAVHTSHDEIQTSKGRLVEILGGDNGSEWLVRTSNPPCVTDESNLTKVNVRSET